MVPMMEVLRYSFAGVYSVLSWLSHSILVLPELRWSRLLVVSGCLVGFYASVVKRPFTTRSNLNKFDKIQYMKFLDSAVRKCILRTRSPFLRMVFREKRW
jgi:hypothetical protein